MKKIISVLLVAVMVFALSACGGNDQPQEDTGNGNEEGIKVALLLTGPANDGGWNKSAYDGLKLAESELGATVACSESVQITDMEAQFTEYANQGYDLVIGHGFQFADPAMKVAADFPDTKFVCIEAEASGDNVASYIMKCEEPAYLMGVLAASMTKTNKIGFVSGLEGPSLIKIVEAYKYGVKETNPDIEFMEIYTGSFEDVARAKEAAVSMINKGADIIGHNANQAGIGAIKAAEENGLLATGDSLDQNSIAPETVMCSTVYNVPLLVKAAVEDVQNGTFKGEIVEMGMKEGIVGISSYNGFESKVPEDIKTKIADLEAKIKSGELVVPKIVTITK